MTVQEFLDQYKGKGIDFDGAFGNQCMDLALQYNQDIIHAPRLTGNAVDVWNTYPKDFYTQNPNTPENFPQLGDIVIWGTGIGQYGHIAICQTGDTNSFTSLDQNWNGHQYCEYVTHNYTSVLGWLRPKTLPQDQTAALDALRKARDDNWNLYQAEVQKNTDLTKQLQDEQKNNQDLRNANDSITKADADLGTQLLDAQHKTTSLQVDLDIVAANVGLTAPYTFDDIVKTIEALKKPHDELVKNIQPVIEAFAAAATYKRVPTQPTLLDTIKGWFVWLKK